MRLTFLSLASVATTCLAFDFQQKPFNTIDTKITHQSHGHFLHVTDFHVDRYYEADTVIKSACHDAPTKHRHRKQRHGKLAGFWGTPTSICDAPMRLAEHTVNYIANKWRDDIDFIIWTGDNARHDTDSTRPRTTKELLTYNWDMTNLLQKSFVRSDNTTIPIVPCIGNNDVHPHNKLKPFDLQLQAYSVIWKDLIPLDQQPTFQQGGYFVVDVAPGVRVMSLNTMYFFSSNDDVEGCHVQDDPGNKHIAWMRTTLAQARNDDVKVYVIGHVVPSKKTFYRDCLDEYIDVSLEYKDVIAGHMYGHANMDHFQLLKRRNEQEHGHHRKHGHHKHGHGHHDDTDTAEEGTIGIMRNMKKFLRSLRRQYKKARHFDSDSLIAVHVAPPVLPVYYPAFRMNQYDTSTGDWTQYTQFFSNLTYWNMQDHLTLPTFEVEYSTDETYNMTDLSVDSWIDLAKRMMEKSEQGEKLWNTYLNNMLVQTDSDLSMEEHGSPCQHHSRGKGSWWKLWHQWLDDVRSRLVAAND
ncbi:Metallo-dependent phosphatase-like protein [Radiomyces spectabilis]|uniref:Metallo-dependent phosphatase-like protein n=1 Tax=Radiomyces spectabilis TaxID=64574 RepID=UPI00221F52D1|nr:Metallo-dependent phosphatase-like protein [Radiomyces spectabilis]KAI8390943.1 Metallo-dependent phosphatase-like protein [Radiomyces spectabilis]